MHEGPMEYCPSCRAPFNATTALNAPEPMPARPGDLSLCFYCGAQLVYHEGDKNNGLKLVLLGDDEKDSLPKEVKGFINTCSDIIRAGRE